MQQGPGVCAWSGWGDYRHGKSVRKEPGQGAACDMVTGRCPCMATTEANGIKRGLPVRTPGRGDLIFILRAWRSGAGSCAGQGRAR